MYFLIQSNLIFRVAQVGNSQSPLKQHIVRKDEIYSGGMITY